VHGSRLWSSSFGFCFGDGNVTSFMPNPDISKKTTSGHEGFTPERRIGREPMPFSLAEKITALESGCDVRQIGERVTVLAASIPNA
jgi:hypothetical protein